jgi:hypothetical protein
VAASFQNDVLFSFYLNLGFFEHFTDKGKLLERVGRKAIGPSHLGWQPVSKEIVLFLLRTISQEY